MKDTENIIKKKKLIGLIKNLNNVELNEIYNILKINDCAYTENKNGIFINLANIDEKILDDIYNFINFSKTKNEELIIKEEIIEKHRENINKYNNNIFNNIKFTDNIYYSHEADSDSDNELIHNKINGKIEYISKYEKYINIDDEETLENINLKKKKSRYTGTKARIIKSYSNKDKKTEKEDEL
jgi:hypothetical protein